MPGRPPAVDFPIDSGLLAFAVKRELIGGRTENFFYGALGDGSAGHLAAVFVTAGPSAKRSTRIAILISCPQRRTI